ncbi:MAG: hypothetical protein WCS37_08555 [Chloroflexota bacterium]|nr:hypothetical protein [Chloroflexota bacterium]
MDWEQVLINTGVVSGFSAFMVFWVGLAMWLRVDANKYGMLGWAWSFIGISGGPLALFAYLIIRGNRSVLEIVHERDALLAKMNCKDKATIPDPHSKLSEEVCITDRVPNSKD